MRKIVQVDTDGFIRRLGNFQRKHVSKQRDVQPPLVQSPSWTRMLTCPAPDDTNALPPPQRFKRMDSFRNIIWLDHVVRIHSLRIDHRLSSIFVHLLSKILRVNVIKCRKKISLYASSYIFQVSSAVFFQLNIFALSKLFFL